MFKKRKTKMCSMSVIVLLLLAAISGCSGDGGGSAGTDGDTVINIAAIPGVAVPVRGEVPETTEIDTVQYNGTIHWSPDHTPFTATTEYTATIVLTAKTGYTLTGVAANFFTVAGATATNMANSGTVNAVFPATGAVPDTVINIAAIPGVVVPVRGEVPVTTAIDTAQYNGTINWSPDDNPFAATTVYTATIVLTAKTGYTLTGVAANFFTVAGATATNTANSGTVNAVFPATGAVPDIDVIFSGVTQTGGTSGTVDSTGLTLNFDVDPTTLTAANITVTDATKGALSGSGTTRSIAISNITVANGATVSVTITSPAGYSIAGSPQTAVVYRAPYIGMPYQGGVIAYLLQSGDPGYDASVPHGLIAATADQSTGIAWISGGSTQTTSVPGGTGTALGTGSANTDKIIAQAVAAGNTTPTSYAAGLARAYNGGGYTDWYLPSKDELNKLYINRVEIGGFDYYYTYWSSSESEASFAWYVVFTGGYLSDWFKVDGRRVRAVRAF